MASRLEKSRSFVLSLPELSEDDPRVCPLKHKFADVFSVPMESVRVHGQVIDGESLVCGYDTENGSFTVIVTDA